MRIGIDGRALQGNRTGIGRYVFELCRAIDVVLPDATFLVYSNIPLVMPVYSSRWILRTDTLSWAKWVKPIIWLKSRCSMLCSHDQLDVFWGAATFLPYLPQSVRTITTVYDLNHKLVPATMPNKLRCTFNLFFSRDVKRADSVLAISQGTSDRLAYFIGRKADVIIYPAIDGLFQPQSTNEVQKILSRYTVVGPYILAVATWEPRKNLELIFKTFVDMKRRGLLAGYKLVLVGDRGWKDQRLASFLADCNDVHPLGYVPDIDLASLYTGADLFVFPSLYEGFGMPVLEARACGTTVVTTDIPELREAGGELTIYIEPSSQGLEQGILRGLCSPRLKNNHDSYPRWQDGAKALADAFYGSNP